MSSFSVEVREVLAVSPIEGADRIVSAQIEGFQTVVPKDSVSVGDLVVYIPEASVVPEWILQKMNLEGKLAGTAKNRVKPVKLKKVLSEGLVFSLKDSGIESPEQGKDYSEVLGITKYEPPIPTFLAGQVASKWSQYCFKYDFDNIKYHMNTIEEGEPVNITEKLHGTLCVFAILPGVNDPELLYGNVLVSSKGQFSKGLILKNTPENEHNLYVKTVKKLIDGSYALQESIEQAHQEETLPPVYFFGEIYGKGIQDLTYSVDHSFAGFDICIGRKFMDARVKERTFRQLGLEPVPSIYVGPWSPSLLEKYTGGTSIIDPSQIKEGIVIEPLEERSDYRGNRVKYKSISEAYLLRKGGSEFN